MSGIDAAALRTLLEAVVASLSTLGGAMAYVSGFRAASALISNADSAEITEQIGVGVAWGFLFGMPLATSVLILFLSA